MNDPRQKLNWSESEHLKTLVQAMRDVPQELLRDVAERALLIANGAATFADINNHSFDWSGTFNSGGTWGDVGTWGDKEKE